MTKKNEIKKFFLIFLSCFILVSTTGCINQDEKNKVSIKNTLVVGLSSPIFGFYPWMNSYDTSTLSMNHNIFDTLVEFDEVFHIKASLAESWNNPDNLTWRFRLRKNVDFHNGYNLTSEDIKYSIDLIKNDQYSVLRDLLVGVKEVRIVDNYTVDIITNNPCPVLLNKLTDIFIVSKKYQEETLTNLPVGTGAYKFIEYSENNYTILERFDNYWRKKPVVKTVKFMLIEDDEERKDALISKEVDIAENILPLFYDNLSKTPGIKTYLITTPTVYYIGFDFRENNSSGYKDTINPLSNVKVRKAIYHAINISEIIKRVYNTTLFCEPASQFLTPAIFGYNPNISRLSYDLEKAKQLLNESGYSNGFDLVMDTILESYNYLEICDVIEEQLSKIVNITLNKLPIDEYYKKCMMRNSSFYITGWIPATGDGGEIYDYLIRTVNTTAGIGTYNSGYYANPEVDRIGEEITYTMDPEIRLNLMQQGFEIAMNDVACIPLFSIKALHGAADYIDWIPSLNTNIKVENIGFK